MELVEKAAGSTADPEAVEDLVRVGPTSSCPVLGARDAVGGLGCFGFAAAMSFSAGGWDSPGPPDISKKRCERFNATESGFEGVCMRGGTVDAGVLLFSERSRRAGAQEAPRSGKYDNKRTPDGTRDSGVFFRLFLSQDGPTGTGARAAGCRSSGRRPSSRAAPGGRRSRAPTTRTR